MVLIYIKEKELEAHLIGNQAFIYKDGASEVLNIDGIEESENAEELIISELELIEDSSFSNSSSFF